MGFFTFIFGALVGGGGTYYYFRDKIEGGEVSDYGLQGKLVAAEAEVRTLKSKLADCEQQLKAAQQELETLRGPQEAVKPEPEPEPVEPHAQTVESSPPSDKSDDLRKIQGVGPKVAQLLVDSGISTYARLAETSVERIREILEEAGPPFKGMNPENWPEQATYAAKDDWDGLKGYQATL